jgi:predicted transcriptional regulator
MTAKATTFRLDPEVRDELSTLSNILDESQNRLANEAIREYVARRSLDVEAELESTLKKLRAYRKVDPGFRRAIADAAAAEVAVAAADDPAEGQVISDPRLTSVATRGPAEAAILDLLED